MDTLEMLGFVLIVLGILNFIKITLEMIDKFKD